MVVEEASASWGALVASSGAAPVASTGCSAQLTTARAPSLASALVLQFAAPSAMEPKESQKTHSVVLDTPPAFLHTRAAMPSAPRHTSKEKAVEPLKEAAALWRSFPFLASPAHPAEASKEVAKLWLSSPLHTARERPAVASEEAASPGHRLPRRP